MFLLSKNALAHVWLTHLEIQKWVGIKSHAYSGWSELVASDCVVGSTPGSLFYTDGGLTFDEVEASRCEFLLNPRISSTTRRECLMKDGSESFEMTGCILQNNLVFFFYLLPNKLNVHGKEILDTLIFVFGMYFPTYGGTRHLHEGLQAEIFYYNASLQIGEN